MTPLPPFPTFNGPVVALHATAKAPARVHEETMLLAGADRFSESAAPPPAAMTEAAVSDDAAASLSIPAGYRLVKVEVLEMIAAEMARLKQFEHLPSFLTADHLRRHA